MCLDFRRWFAKFVGSVWHSTGFSSHRGGVGLKSLILFFYIHFSLSISLRRLNMFEILFSDPFYIQLTCLQTRRTSRSRF